ncbi:MAG: DUF4091 domain-containing protein [Firmicutes bacterium]|nr:DUF4091 domain-containing protein [Bacillota bacterium]
MKCVLTNEAYKYVHGIRKKWVFPEEQEQAIKLTCAKNDWASVQLLLYSESEMLVAVNDEPLFYERGPIEIVRVAVDVPGLDKGDVKVRLVGMVEDDDRQLKSDILLAQSYAYVEPRKTQPVWIEIAIDKDVQPGIYRPEITVFGHHMFEDEKVVCKKSFEMNVRDVVLKDAKDYGFYLDLWQHNCNIARKYDVLLWSEKHFEIMEKYIKALADLGQKAISVVVSEIPWSGQNCCYNRLKPSNLFEYSMVKVIKDEQGNWHYDFSALNRYIELCMAYGIDTEIEVFGLLNIWLMEDAGYGKVIQGFDDGIRVRYFDEKERIYRYIDDIQDLQSYISGLEQNFIDKGWIEKVRILADEPEDVEAFKARLNRLRQMAPHFKIKLAIDHIEFMEEQIPGVTDFVPIFHCLCQKYDKAEVLKKTIEGKFIYYVCCIPEIPNTFISSPLIEGRIIPWFAYYFGLDGFLRWNFTVWPDDPLASIVYQYPHWRAGDTNFVYPGKDGTPLLTLRYMNLKRGIRDFEIFQSFIQNEGNEGELKEWLKEVFYWKEPSELTPTARKKPEELYSLKYNDYEKIVEKILLSLEENK